MKCAQIAIQLLLISCLVSPGYAGQVSSYSGTMAASLNQLDRQILGMPFFQPDKEEIDPASLPRTTQTQGAAVQAARSSVKSAALQEQSARAKMAAAESVLASRTAGEAQKQQAEISYGAAKMAAESAKRTKEEQALEASKQAMYEEQAAERCRGALTNYQNDLAIIGSENLNARRLFAAGDFPAALSSLDKVKKATATAQHTLRVSSGCDGFPHHEVKFDKVSNQLLEARALQHTQGEAGSGETVLQLYLQTLVDGERGDAAPFIWDIYQESNRLLNERFGGKFELKRKLRLPIEGVEIGKIIGKKDMERLEFDVFQGFHRDMSQAACFDYARRFAKRDVESRDTFFYKESLEHLEHPARGTRASGVFTDDQIFYYAACYYEFSGRISEVPNIYRAYENFVDAQKEPAAYRAFANYREMKTHMDQFLAANNLSLPATTPLKWGINKELSKNLEERKRLENLKKQPGMNF